MIRKFFALSFIFLFSCNLKAIQQYEAKKSFVLYQIKPGADKQLQEIMNSKSISIRHTEEGKVYIRTKKQNSEFAYYQIKRDEEKGLNIDNRISVTNDQWIENLFREEALGNEPSDTIFYKKNEDKNLKFNPSEIRFFILNEASTSKDKKLEGHKFNFYIIKLECEKKDQNPPILWLRHIKVESLIKKLLSNFKNDKDKVSYIMKYFFKSEKHMYKAGLNSNISRNKYKLKEDEIEKIKKSCKQSDYIKDRAKKELLQRKLYEGKINKWFTTKVDKGIYVMIESGSGEFFLKAFELRANYKDYNNEEHLQKLKQKGKN